MQWASEQPLAGPNGSGNNIVGYEGLLVSAGTGFPINRLANNISQDRIA